MVRGVDAWAEMQRAYLQRTLRGIANAQNEFGKQFKQLIQTAAPALDLSGEQPLSNELLFSWQPSYVSEKPT